MALAQMSWQSLLCLHIPLLNMMLPHRVVMNVSQTHPTDAIELPPTNWLSPLEEALTHEQHMAALSEQERQVGAGGQE